MLGHYLATKLSVFALRFGAFWLNEHISTDLMWAMLLVAIGTGLVSRRSRPIGV